MENATSNTGRSGSDGGGGTSAQGEPACTEGADDIYESVDIDPAAGLETCKGFAETRGDYYHFALRENARLTYSVEASKTVTVQLFYEKFGEVIINQSVALDTLMGSSVPGYRELNLEKGDYFLRVTGPNTGFKLELSAVAYGLAEPEPEPGQSTDGALLIGVVEERAASYDFGGYVGGTDPADFYVFELTTHGVLKYTLAKVEGGVVGRIYRKQGDQTNVEAPPEGTVTGATDSDGTTTTELPAGEHYMRITTSHGTSSLYSLLLSFEEG